MRIADLGNMEAQVNVNENDVVNVKVGDPRRSASTPIPTARSTASCARSPHRHHPERRLAGRGHELPGEDHASPTTRVALRPGMSATADIETATVQNAVAVPIQSVTVRSTDSKLSPEEREKQSASAGGGRKERQPRRCHQRNRRETEGARPARETDARRLHQERRQGRAAESRDRNRRQRPTSRSRAA